MTYSQCPFEPVVKGRGMIDKIAYKVRRHWLRTHWREIEAGTTKALDTALVKGTGYLKIMCEKE